MPDDPGPPVARVQAASPAGIIFCLNPRCQHEIEHTYRDPRRRLYVLTAHGARWFVRHAELVECPYCGQWRSWGGPNKGRAFDRAIKQP